jgi:DNA processing protein
MTELHSAYVYSLAHLAHLGERSALKLKRLFPTYNDWLKTPEPERRKMVEQIVGQRSSGVVTGNWDGLIDRAVRDLREHDKEDIRTLDIDDADYPPLLRLISNPPLVLFVKGSVKSLTERTNVAIIGTRDCTSKGEEVATRVAKFFGSQECAIVSGLAKGIDTAAHKGALEANAPTIAVFATPLNKVYPAENKPLAESILKMDGSWISEIPLWKRPHRSSFVERDRIQSGLSAAVIPVQTDVQGGTMHTVGFAEEQKRLLFCPRPLNGERHLKQYAGIAALIDSKRATPFQLDDYVAVLDQVRAHAQKLTQAAKEKSADQLRSVSNAESHDRALAVQTLRVADTKNLHDQVVERLAETFASHGLAGNESYFDEAVKVVRQKLFGVGRKKMRSQVKSAKEWDSQVFKARLSRPIDKAMFAEKWKERSGGMDMRFRIQGTDLTATDVRTRTLWDANRDAGSEVFFNVLQVVLQEIARDCAILDCEEVTNVNS